MFRHVFPPLLFILRAFLVVAATGVVHAAVGSMAGYETSPLGTMPAVAAEGRATARGKTTPMARPAPSNDRLPRNVAEMRDAILAAAAGGRLDELRTAIEMNEMPPDVEIASLAAAGQSADPIERLRAASKSFAMPETAPKASTPEANAVKGAGQATAGGAPGAVAQHSAAAAALIRPVADGRDILATLERILTLPPAVVHTGRDHENAGIYVWPFLAERDLKALTVQDRETLEALAGPEFAAGMLATGSYRYWRIAIGADGTWLSLSGP